MAVECNFGSNGGAESRIRHGGLRRLLIVAPAGSALEAVVAERFAARLLGLAFLPATAAPPLLIPSCRSVHTFGMRFALDVCFLALPAGALRGTAAVVAVRSRVRPRRFASAPRGAGDGRVIASLELAAGTAAELGIEPGGSVRVAPP